MKHKPFVILPTEEGKEIINTEEIISISPGNKNTVVTTEENEKLKVKLSMAAIYELLDKTLFVRCHRSCIINLSKVKRIYKAYVSVTLNNGAELPIARANKSLFKESFNQFHQRCMETSNN